MLLCRVARHTLFELNCSFRSKDNIVSFLLHYFIIDWLYRQRQSLSNIQQDLTKNLFSFCSSFYKKNEHQEHSLYFFDNILFYILTTKQSFYIVFLMIRQQYILNQLYSFLFEARFVKEMNAFSQFPCSNGKIWDFG